MKDAPFKSGFAILDVKKGRHALAKAIGAGGKVRVRVDVTLDAVQSPDDGTSIEFSGLVTSVKAFRQPGAAKRRVRRR